jgi:hypothetical protein
MLFNEKKAIQAITYLTHREGGKIDKVKAMKLMWLSDRFSLLNYATLITNDNYVAMPKGPVPSHTLDLINQPTSYATVSSEAMKYASDYLVLAEGQRSIIEALKHPDLDCLSLSDKHSLDKVYSAYGSKDSDWLSEHSHSFPEWANYEKAIENGEINSPINLDYFFTTVIDETGLFDEDQDCIDVIKEQFEISRALHAMFGEKKHDC